jgi:hypothetical protein
LVHTSELVERYNVVLMASDMLPCNRQWKGLDNSGNANAEIVFGTKRVTRKRKGDVLNGLSEVLKEALVVGGGSDPGRRRGWTVSSWTRG